MTTLNSPIPRFHLAMPVDDLDAASQFYGDVLGLPQGRSADTWVDWNLDGHQFVTHLAPSRSQRVHNPVDGHDVPVRISASSSPSPGSKSWPNGCARRASPS